MVHDAMEDVEGEFERYPALSVPTFPARVRFRVRNTYWCWGAAIEGVSIRTGLGKRPVYMAIKLLWHKIVQILRSTERKPFNFCTIILLQDYTALDTLLYTLLTLDMVLLCN